jgi:hypothetical protein
MIFFFLMSVIFWILVPVGFFLFGRRVFLSLEQRRVSDIDTASLSDRMRKLEDRVEEMALDIERISDGQQFAAALLARPAKEEPE